MRRIIIRIATTMALIVIGNFGAAIFRKSRQADFRNSDVAIFRNYM
jgi:hypothetical protein